MCAANYDFEIFKGDEFCTQLNASKPDGSLYDLTNYTVSGFLKYRFSDTDYLYNLNPTIYSPPTSGIILLDISSTGVATLPSTILRYDIIIYSGTNNGTRVIYGNFNVLPGVTL